MVAYGVGALLLAFLLLVVGLQVRPLLQSLPTQLAGSLRTTALTLGSAAVAAGGARVSLEQAGRVTAAASQTSLGTSANVRQLAQALNFEVFGNQPFGELVPRFTDTADNLQQLGTSLAGTSQALEQSAAQTAEIQNNLTATQQQLNQLAGTLDAGLGGAAMPIVLVAVGTWVLLLAQALMTLVGGLLLLRR